MNSPEEEFLSDPTERELVDRLERYGDSLRSGQIRLELGTDPDEVSPEARARLEAARAAISMLRQARTVSATPSRPQIAGYELLEVLGRGGMGIVYKARDLALNRLVALKLILGGVHARSVDLARFRTEAEAVARLDHPNIVRIYEVGQQDQQGVPMPYMTLELVESGTLATRLDGTPQPLRTAAALVETLAHAVNYAHERGIVHRDLKPANILIADNGLFTADTRTPDQPAIRNPQSAVPKIADFGLAKRLEDTATQHTSTGAVLGTAQYMAPEQAAGRNQLVGPATDTYALGAILYHLLTGRPPFSGETPTDILLQVLNEEPISLRRLRPQISRDLETICLKCLEKEPGKRYPSARALAEDLNHFLDARPITARRVGPLSRLARMARRRPVVASLSAALVVVTLLGVVLVGWQWHVAVANAEDAKSKAIDEAKARREAERNAHANELLLLEADIDRALLYCERGDLTLGLLSLSRCLTVAIRVGETDLERVVRRNLAGWRTRFYRQRAQLQHDDWAWDVAFSPDGRFVLTGSRDRKARLWDALTCELHIPPMEHPWPVWSVTFSPDGRSILSGCGSEDGRLGEGRIWDIASRSHIATLLVGNRVEYAAFDCSGKHILTRGPHKAQLWKMPPSGKETVLSPIELLHPDRVLAALFSPDGRSVLTCGSDGTARLWDSATGQSQGEPMQNHGRVATAAFRPDGRVFAVGVTLVNVEGKPTGAEIRFWETATGKQLGPTLPQTGPLKCLAFSPDGRMLLAGGIVVPTEGVKPSGAARLYDAEYFTPLGPLLEHPQPVWVVAFSPDGRTFLTGCEDRVSRQWQTATCTLAGPVGHHNGTVRSVAFSPDGRRFVCGSASDTPQVQLWEAAQGLAIGPPLYHTSPVNALAQDSSGKFLITGCADGTTWVWDRLARRPMRTLKDPRKDILGVSVSPDGAFIASASAEGSVQLWSTNTGEPVGERLQYPNSFWCVGFSPDGTTLVTGRGNRQAGAQRWRMPGGKYLADLAHPGLVRALAFGPDGRWLLTAGQGGVFRWDTDSGKLLDRELLQIGQFCSVAVSPDGKSILAGSDSQTAQRWETATGRRSGQPLLHQGTVNAVAFSKDGRLLLTASQDKTARVWDAVTGKPLTPPLLHRGAVTGAAFLPDGKSLVTAGIDQTVQFWEIPNPTNDSPEQVRADIEFLTGMELDERGVVRQLSMNDWLKRQR